MSQSRRFAVVAAVTAAVLLAAAFGVDPRSFVERAEVTGQYRPQADSVVPAAADVAALNYSVKRNSVSRAGLVTAESGIAVANLTVRPGNYILSYEFEARLDAVDPSMQLRCGLVDNNGFRRFFVEDPKPIAAGHGWERRTLVTNFSLPDVTIGIRCIPTETGLLQASFRDVALSAARVSP